MHRPSLYSVQFVHKLLLTCSGNCENHKRGFCHLLLMTLVLMLSVFKSMSIGKKFPIRHRSTRKRWHRRRSKVRMVMLALNKSAKSILCNVWSYKIWNLFCLYRIYFNVLFLLSCHFFIVEIKICMILFIVVGKYKYTIVSSRLYITHVNRMQLMN